MFAYWYEGAPEYVSAGELGLESDDEVRTAILCCMFGFPSPPEGWVQVASSYTSSGEAPCWWCGDREDDGDHHDDGDGEGCKLCGGDGYVYLGDGWAEVVYRRIR